MHTFSLSNGPHGTSEVFEYLVVCARNMFTDNYGNLVKEVERRSRGAIVIPAIGVGPHLGYIRSACIAAPGVPWINSLAVSLNTWRPSDGFLPADVNWDPAHELLWRGMVLQVYCFDWTTVTVV